MTFTEFQHKWVQRSVIVRFEPEEGASEDVVILGTFPVHVFATVTDDFFRCTPRLCQPASVGCSSWCR